MSKHIPFDYLKNGDFGFLPLDVLRKILLYLPPAQCYQIVAPLNSQFHDIVHEYLFKKLQLQRYYPEVDVHERVPGRSYDMCRNTCYECGYISHDSGDHPFYNGNICKSCWKTDVKYAFFSIVKMRTFLHHYIRNKRCVKELIFFYCHTYRIRCKYGKKEVLRFTEFFQWLCEKYPHEYSGEYFRFSFFDRRHLFTVGKSTLLYDWMQADWTY